LPFDLAVARHRRDNRTAAMWYWLVKMPRLKRRSPGRGYRPYETEGEGGWAGGLPSVNWVSDKPAKAPTASSKTCAPRARCSFVEYSLDNA
jgi:hypothetical protein